MEESSPPFIWHKESCIIKVARTLHPLDNGNVNLISQVDLLFQVWWWSVYSFGGALKRIKAANMKNGHVFPSGEPHVLHWVCEGARTFIGYYWSYSKMWRDVSEACNVQVSC